MVREKKVYMPSGAGGLIRYQETGEQKIVLKPEHVVYAVVAIVAMEIALKIFFG